MSNQIEAMKMAMEALEEVNYHGWGETQARYDKRTSAITALREALAEQPEPLPVKTYSGGKAWHVAPTKDKK